MILLKLFDVHSNFFMLVRRGSKWIRGTLLAMGFIGEVGVAKDIKRGEVAIVVEGLDI